jgi:hypothetical protein
MGSTTREQAKSVIANLTVRGTHLVRFTVNTSFGFGLELRATWSGFEAWVSAVEATGLDPMMNRAIRVEDTDNPAEYFYDVFVEIPEGWTKP